MVNALTSNDIWSALMRDVELAEMFSADVQLRHMMAFETAWTRCLAELGVVPEQTAQKALAVLEVFKLDHGGMARGLSIDGLPVPELVRQLKAAAPENARKAIHTGATSQDVLDTALALTCRAVSKVISGRLERVATQLTVLDDRFSGYDLMGRTRMQAALPIGVSARLASWSRGFDEAQKSFSTAAFEMEVVQVAGPVGLRDMPEGRGHAMAEAIARVLDLELAPPWHTNRGRVARYGHALAEIAVALAKIAGDILLMVQQGVDDVSLEEGGTSSAMAHKSNPVKAETIVALQRFVSAQQGLLLQSGVHEQERSGVAWTVEWLTLPAMVEAIGRAMALTIEMLEQIDRIGSSS